MTAVDLVVTPRWSHDFYPTPPAVTNALASWLASQDGAPGPADHFLDPAGGVGDLIEALRDVWGEAFHHAIEIDPGRALALDSIVEHAVHGDALAMDWPAAHVIANPPFSSLDEFWTRIAAHRAEHGTWCAALTPVAWWSAEKRAGYVRPDFILALGWRPVFHIKNGPAHKGSQDFCWSILAPAPQPVCLWQRVEKPRAVSLTASESRGVASTQEDARAAADEAAARWSGAGA